MNPAGGGAGARALGLALLAALASPAACSRKDKPPSPAAAASAPASGASCPDAPLASEAAPGLTVERVRASAAPTVEAGDRCITLVRVDLTRYDARLLMGRARGGARTVEKWADDEKLSAAVNAAMYGEDERSVGLMVDGKTVGNGGDNPKYGGFLAFGPRRAGLPAVKAEGRGCPGFDLSALRRDYRTVIQNYRLLDCDGRAVPWRDPKIFSASFVGTDEQGRLVLGHVRTPYSMTALAAMLADPRLGLTSAMHTEGGPEASLYVRAGTTTVRAVGSYETGFFASDRNVDYRPVPNVLGVTPKP